MYQVWVCDQWATGPGTPDDDRVDVGSPSWFDSPHPRKVRGRRL